VIANARDKRRAKGCDWIVANDVSEETGIMGGGHNQIHLVTGDGIEDWPKMAKQGVADALMRRAAEHLAGVAQAAE
jgi:phosphopantothenoylcysteine decarboxylase/phosphopantothenate--cysteine ligase